MTINYLSVKKGVPASGYWDQEFIKDLLIDLPESSRSVVLIPGAYQGDVIPEINKELAKYKKVLVFVTSDEEGKFNVDALEHPDMIVYSQYGNGGIAFPIGYPPNTRDILSTFIPISRGNKKDIKWFFSGQITHYRRKVMASMLKKIGGGVLNETDGFAKGFNQSVYLEMMVRSKVAICCPGPISQDSFRLYEALEAGCIPVVDDVSPIRSSGDRYLFHMFSDAPFPMFSDFNDFPNLLKYATSNPELGRWIFAWWINMKYRLKSVLKKNLGIPDDDMTVVIPVSPIPSHPETTIIDETIQSIRSHISSPILVTIDGVRKEQEDMRSSYNLFIDKLLWKCNFEYKDVLPVIFSKHRHQSGMMNDIIGRIKSKYVMYVEQDTPLVKRNVDDPSTYIDWGYIKDSIGNGKANCIRLHFEAFIPDAHKHLMIGTPENNLLKTRQWSQRPHIASVQFYKSVMSLFSDKSNCFIEDYIHGKLQDGDWNKWKVFIYHPSGSIKRSYHLNGRNGAEKYDDRQIW